MDPVLTRARRVVVRRPSDRQVVVACVVVAVVLRLPFVLTPLGIDEGGYAYVAKQWAEGDGGLYGSQWVDRPPLLIALFAVATSLAGNVGIWLLGCVSAGVLVASSMATARVVAGRDAMTWTGVAAVALTSSTLLQSYSVNAELPAAALVAAGVWLTIVSLRAITLWRAWWTSVAAGVTGASALLVKQSFADGLLFALAAIVAMLVLARASRRTTTAVLTLAGGVVGTVLVVACAMAWAQLIGPGAWTLVDALYGFRLDAGATLRAAASTAPRDRAILLAMLVVASGMLALFVYATIGIARIAAGRQHLRSGVDDLLVRAASWGLVVMGAWGVFAITQGGNWWRHYLVQLVPMLAVAIGIVVGGVVDVRRSRVAQGSKGAARAVAGVATVAWVATAAWAAIVGLQRAPAEAGDWLRAASRPGDTVVVAWGSPNVLERSGLRSPYPLAWSLPVRVRDPQLEELRRILLSPNAPTWLVEWQPFNSWGLDRDGRFRQLVRLRYERITSLCGRDVYRLRSAGTRSDSMPAAPAASDCEAGSIIGAVDVPSW